MSTIIIQCNELHFLLLIAVIPSSFPSRLYSSWFLNHREYRQPRLQYRSNNNIGTLLMPGDFSRVSDSRLWSLWWCWILVNNNQIMIPCPWEKGSAPIDNKKRTDSSDTRYIERTTVAKNKFRKRPVPWVHIDRSSLCVCVHILVRNTRDCSQVERLEGIWIWGWRALVQNRRMIIPS